MATFQLLANSRYSNNEIFRKAIHISGFSIPLVFVNFFNVQFLSVTLFLLMVVYVTSEVARNHGIDFPLFSRITRKAAVSSFEKNNYATAPIAFTLGIIFSLLLFSPSIAYASIAVLTIGDSSANVFGKIFGKTPHPINKKKTVEGTICGFVCALLGSVLFIDPLKALIAVSAGMFAEAFSLPISENLSIPLTSGIILTIFSF